ncbi:hypothetical protein SLEP1_g51254 [Rubroshorea leprosula]|uniref:AAA+ ATPase domain-containing protein n=1 Tax=Rubroshorea leprosula TaxID=152421 RepID=A0AAV5M3F3_9ROSI|nr:hypothetical protein SLEP1_g51254 [Rubroshorea leprosula]
MATEIGVAAGGKCAEHLVETTINLISQPITLVYKRSDNVRNLKDKLALLTDRRESVQHDVTDGERKAEEIEQEVKNWMSKADDYITGEAKKSWDELEEKAKKRCFLGLCLNPKSLYRLSKKAEEDALAVGQLLEAKFNRISFFHVEKEKADLIDEVFKDFDSRRHVLKEIMEALLTPSIKKIGVYGMPGVGKTLLAGEVKRKAEQEKLFDAVVIAKVTKNPDLKSIQQEIQRGLGLELPDGIPEWGAAARIKSTLTKRQNVLVILDDIWGRVALEDVGIPLSANEQKQPVGQKNDESSAEQQIFVCKVLLTSRDRSVLSGDMGTEKEFLVGQLEDNESWELFKKIVGKDVERHELRQIGREIAKESRGLPIAVATIGNALKNKSVHDWKDALLELKRPSPNGKSAKFFSAIEFSFKHLEREELKQTFLMCSLLSHNAAIEELVKYGVGLGLFLNVRTIEETRNRVLSLVDHLKASSLLVDGRGKMYFDMHDLIRDVAKSMASRNYGLFTSRDEDMQGGWPEKEVMTDLKWIFLSNGDACGGLLPDKFQCPKLTFFHLSNYSLAIPTNFFSGIEKLRVLGLTKTNLSPMPVSIALLTDLRTLRLDQSVLGDEDVGAIIGKLKNLQVLSLAGCEIEELPKEVGSLTELKLLDLSDCTQLKVIPQQVLASLSKLQELKMGNSFYQWDVMEHGRQRNASLSELTQLPRLTALELRVLDVQTIPGKLERYKIFMGDVWNNWDSSFDSLKVLKLQMKAHIRFDYSIKRLLKMTEELHLEELNGVKNVVDELDIEGFPDLKYLYICNAPELHQIVNLRGWGPFSAFPNLEVLFLRNLIKLEKLFQARFKDTAFSKLRTITIECCHQLKNLFSFSIASQFLQLQEIKVSDCSNMEEIIDLVKEQRSREDIVEASQEVKPKFGQLLRSLRLQRLPKLISFNSNCSTMPLFNDQFLFPNLEELQLSWINVDMIWIASYCVENLTKLIIHGCHNLKYLFSTTMARSLEKLGHLDIRECKMMTKIIPQLEELSLTEDDILMICGEIKFKENLFFNIKVLHIQDYLDMSAILPICFLNRFSNLEKLFLKNCYFTELFPPKGEQVGDQEKQVETEVLSRIKILRLDSFPNLKHILSQDSSTVLQNLQTLEVWRCNSLPCLLISNTISLHNLTTLDVSGCDSGMKTLVSVPLARSLVQLEHITVSECDSLTEIVGHEGDRREDSDINFNKLRILKLKCLPRLGSFCSENFSFNFPSLEMVTVDQCPKLKIFSEGGLCTPLLQRVELTEGEDKSHWAGDLNTTIQKMHTEKVGFAGLEDLTLSDFPELIEIWHDRERRQAILDFRLLEYLQLDNCAQLSYLLTPSMVSCLVQLVFISIKNCAMMEQVIMGDGEESKMIFPRLLNIKLESCSNLISFYVGSHRLEIPSLERIFIKECQNMVTFAASTSSGEHEKETSHQYFFSSKDTFPSLEELKLEWNDNIKEIWYGQHPEEYFGKLKVVELSCFPKISNFLPPFFFQSLPSLEKLVVRDTFFNEVFQCEEAGVEEKPFVCGRTPLCELRLSELHELTHLWKEESQIESIFSNLKTLEVQECSRLKNLVPSNVHFNNLQTLEVSKCHGLVNLVRYSTAKSLVQLKTMQVTECETIGEIVVCLGDDVKDGIILSKLKYLQLEGLPRLASFCSGVCNFEFPDLEVVIVRECPNMQIFSNGELSTPNLARLKEYHEDEGCWEGNLNSTIQQVFKEKVKAFSVIN